MRGLKNERIGLHNIYKRYRFFDDILKLLKKALKKDPELLYELAEIMSKHDDVWWGLENFSNKEEAEQEFEKIKAKLLAE